MQANGPVRVGKLFKARGDQTELLLMVEDAATDSRNLNGGRYKNSELGWSRLLSSSMLLACYSLLLVLFVVSVSSSFVCCCILIEEMVLHCQATCGA